MVSKNGAHTLNLVAHWVGQCWGAMGYEDGILHSNRVIYVKVKREWVIYINEFVLWVSKLWITK